ncbi:nuclear pore complex protein Nup85-like [Zophobas morio]|uniref:nuclear pore complex protein Nup85-like n=1 Tax=Zophobas morio TaxID=2755281 RepID=UPI0030832CAD
MPEWFTDWSKRVDFAHYEKWKERCYSELLRAGEQESYYVSVLKILSGDELEIKRNSLHWYYMIVGDLCYVDCTVKFTELDQFVPRWQADASDSLNTFDFLVTAALKNEPFEVLRLCQEYGNTWFTAHLFDLIITSGHSSVVAEGKALREDLLVAYANVLLRDNSYGMWQIGADYLKYCGEKGKVEFRNHVDALAQSHQLKVRKVLELCLYFGLVEKYNAICLFHGNTALKNNHFCSALRWFWKGHWQDHVVKVIDQLMDESDKSFEAANRIHGMFAVLSEKDFRCFPRLKILEHYCALNMILYDEAFRDQENLKKAVMHILVIIKAREGRAKYGKVILEKLWELFEICRQRNALVFTMEDCCQLLQGLHELESNCVDLLYRKQHVTESSGSDVRLSQIRRRINWALSCIY